MASSFLPRTVDCLGEVDSLASDTSFFPEFCQARPGVIPRVVAAFSAGTFLCFGATTGVFHDSLAHLAERDPVTSHIGWTGDVVNSSHRGVPQQVAYIKERAGATWSDVSEWFGVSRRAVHYWVQTGELSERNAAQLKLLVGVAEGNSHVDGEALAAQFRSLRPGGFATEGVPLSALAGPIIPNQPMDKGERVFTIKLG